MKKWQKFDPELEKKILAAMENGHQKPGQIQGALGLDEYVKINDTQHLTASVIGECLQDMKARSLIVLGPKGRWMAATVRRLEVECPVARLAELTEALARIGARIL